MNTAANTTLNGSLGSSRSASSTYWAVFFMSPSEFQYTARLRYASASG
jgi:hypothetical protein